MTGTNPFEGGNPFDAFVRRRVPDPSSTGNAKLDAVLKRMEAARLQAEKQRELAHATFSPPVTPSVEATPVAPKAAPKHHVPSGHQIWIMIWLAIWAILTIVGMFGNVIGGLIMTIPLFWACMIVANLPSLFRFDTPGRRNSNGRAV